MSGIAQVYNFNIASGGTLSQGINLQNKTLVGLVMPSALTSTTITLMTTDSEGGTFVDAYKDGSLLSYAVGTSRYIVINPADTVGMQFLRLKCGSSEGDARVIKAVFTPLINKA